MQDEYIRSRGFALTLARRAVDDLRRDQFRQMRNYVDLCQALAEKSRYKGFFDQAQQVLQRADSLYYALVQCLLERVESERLCAFGVNFGVGGIIYGASRLKEEAEQTGKPSAWLNTANCASSKLEEAVARAEQNGRYVWVLYAQDAAAALRAVRVIKQHPYAAFLLVAAPSVIAALPAETFDGCFNLSIWLLLPKPVLEPETVQTARTLCERRLLFGFAVLLDEAGANRAMDSSWLQEMAQWTSFCLYARRPGMAPQTARQLRQSIVRSRTGSAVPILVLDWDGDLDFINRGISELAVVGALVDEELPFPFICQSE